MNMTKFLTMCQETESDGDILTFTGFSGKRDDYHTDRTYWVIPDDEVVQLIRNNLDDWNELETDEERLKFIQELGDDVFSYGGSGSRISDCDTISYNIWSIGFNQEVEGTTPLSSYNDVVFIEDYPYRSGTYSGTYDLYGEEFIEFYVDGDHSPCGGPDWTGLHLSPQVFKRICEQV